MARQVVVLAFLLIALVGLVSAAGNDAAPKTTGAAPSGSESAAAPANDDAIGNTDNDASAPSGGDAAVAGPIGSEETANTSTAQAPTSGATTLGVSTVAGAAALAGYFVF